MTTTQLEGEDNEAMHVKYLATVGTQCIHNTPLTSFALIVLSLIFSSNIIGHFRSKHDTFETIYMQIWVHKNGNSTQ